MTAWIVRILDLFIPPSLKLSANPDLLRKARIICGLSLFGGLVFSVITTVYLFEIDFQKERLYEYSFILLFLTVPFVLKRTGNIFLSGFLLSMFVSCILIYTTFMDGYFPNPALGWFILVVMIAVFLISPGLGLFYALVFSAYTALLFIIGQKTSHIHILHEVSGLGVLSNVFEMSFLYFLTAFASGSIEKNRQKAMAEAVSMNRDLIKERNRAQDAARVKADFMAKMSHEMRTPLSGIIGVADLLSKERFSETQQVYLDALKNSGEILLKIIDDILDFSKFDSKRVHLERVGYKLEKLVREVIASEQPELNKKKIKVEIHIDSQLPPVIIGDPVRVKQVLTNIVGNAVKFTQQGCISIKAVVEGNSLNRLVRVSVDDTGVGFAAANADQLFEPFTQLEVSKTRVYGGTGLGLSICKVLVELMGGEIGAENSSGQGSRFWFTLPMMIGEQGDLRIESRGSMDNQDDIRQLKDLKILVVEDNHINQFVIKKILSHMNIDCTVVGDGRDAIDTAGKKEFDVIMMDCHLPEVDGFEAASAIRRMDLVRQPVIIAVTADVFGNIQEKCNHHGMNFLLSKPLKYEQLRRKLVDIVEKGVDEIVRQASAGR